MSSVLPDAGEARDLVLGPSSVTWRRAGDARLLLGAGTALLLQVAHPTVGAGVSEHSDFRQDPWGRLLRTLDFVNLAVYGGEDAAAVGRRVREMHKRIKGLRPDGARYHALEPEAYAWVHATLAWTIVAGHDRFGRPMPRAERERFLAEWRGIGRLLGVRDRDLPDTWAGFEDYVARTVDERLERTPAVDDVLVALARPAAPPLPGLGPSAWRLLRVPPSRAATLATVGLMSPAMRRRIGLPWSVTQEAELRALGASARALTPVLPRPLRRLGPTWLRLRREAIATGDLLPRAPRAVVASPRRRAA